MADPVDLWRLLQRDHDDIEAGLAAMVHPATPHDELGRLTEVMRLALAVHAAAEAKVADAVLDALDRSHAAMAIISSTRTAHRRQRRACDALLTIEVATSSWYEATLELRDDVLYHAGRSEHALRSLCETLSEKTRRALARVYATERLRMFASTSPAMVADRLDAQAQIT